MNLEPSYYNKNNLPFCKKQPCDFSNICGQNKFFLKCGDPKSTIINLPLSPVSNTVPVTVDIITLNTSCLYDPVVKIDFNINISNDTGVASNLTFRVFKIYNNQPIKIAVGSEWYLRNDQLSRTTAVFTLSVFDRNIVTSKSCSYVTYILEVTPTV